MAKRKKLKRATKRRGKKKTVKFSASSGYAYRTGLKGNAMTAKTLTETKRKALDRSRSCNTTIYVMQKWGKAWKVLAKYRRGMHLGTVSATSCLNCGKKFKKRKPGTRGRKPKYCDDACGVAHRAST